MYETRDLVLVLIIKLPRRKTRMKSTSVIASRLHVSRFGTYMAASNGDEAQAVALYRWNVELAGALFETLTLTEVVLRNALDTQLRTWNGRQRERNSSRRHSVEWTSDPGRPLASLTAKARVEARRAAVRARAGRPATHPRKTAPITHDDIIAQLTFGTFVRLLPTPTQTDPTFRAREVLWQQAISKAFPHRGGNDPYGHATFGRAERLRSLRNRVAHAEPLLSVNARHRLRDAGRLLATIDPTVAGWITGISRVASVADTRPL